LLKILQSAGRIGRSN